MFAGLPSSIQDMRMFFQGPVGYRKDGDILHIDPPVAGHTGSRDPGTRPITDQGAGRSDTEGTCKRAEFLLQA